MLDPRFAYGWKHLGDIFSSSDETKLAQVAYRKAIASSDQYGTAFVQAIEGKVKDEF